MIWARFTLLASTTTTTAAKNWRRKETTVCRLWLSGNADQGSLREKEQGEHDHCPSWLLESTYRPPGGVGSEAESDSLSWGDRAGSLVSPRELEFSGQRNREERAAQGMTGGGGRPTDLQRALWEYSAGKESKRGGRITGAHKGWEQFAFSSAIIETS